MSKEWDFVGFHGNLTKSNIFRIKLPRTLNNKFSKQLSKQIMNKTSVASSSKNKNMIHKFKELMNEGLVKNVFASAKSKTSHYFFVAEVVHWLAVS